MLSQINIESLERFDFDLDGLLRECFTAEFYQATILLHYDSINDTLLAIASNGIPCAPFNGTEQTTIRQAIDDCFEKHPRPHIHNIKGLMMSQRVKRIKSEITTTNKILFYPFQAREKIYIIIALLKHDSNITKIAASTKINVSKIANALKAYYVLPTVENRLKNTSIYVKEVGHDLASSVQAIVPKLKNLRTLNLTESQKSKKLQEAEDEIQSMYRNAESLGIVVDQDYQVGAFNEFDLVDAINRVRNLYLSEANESHIKIKIDTPSQVCQYKGDKQSIELAIGHLVLNAIKYSFGDSYIKIELKPVRDSIKISVVNKSNIPLPTKEEEHFIWEFGYRGEKARATHVNGSGIGLYTVRKISTAHYGYATYERSKNLAIFSIILPSLSDMNRYIRELGIITP